jgi:hypothetical protein
LATVTVRVKRGPAGGDYVALRLGEGEGCHAGYGVAVFNEYSPAVPTIHASAGSWHLDADWSGVESGGERRAGLR